MPEVERREDEGGEGAEEEDGEEGEGGAGLELEDTKRHGERAREREMGG